MVREIIGKKLGMTRLFSPEGDVVPVTVIEAGPCPIIQKKTEEKDGYNALQVGFLPKKPGRVNRPLMGHFKKSGTRAFYILKELRVDEPDPYELGQEICADIFQPGDLVDVTGTSKGRGFSGVMKRHGFRGAPGSHGTHEYSRHGGSIGSAADPSRTFKGKKMPGHFGNRRLTVQNIEVVEVRPQENLIFLKGCVPGWRNGIVTIRHAKKAEIPLRPLSPREKKEEQEKEKVKAEAEKEVKEEGTAKEKPEVKDKDKTEVEAQAKEEPTGVAEEEAQEESKKAEAERGEAEAKEKEEAEAKVKAKEETEVKDKDKAEVEAKAEAEEKEEVKAEGPEKEEVEGKEEAKEAAEEEAKEERKREEE